MTPMDLSVCCTRRALEVGMLRNMRKFDSFSVKIFCMLITLVQRVFMDLFDANMGYFDL